MENLDEQSSLSLGHYWALARHRRWFLIAALFTGWALVVGVSLLLRPRYRSETVILVEQQKVPERYVESNVAIDFQQRLQNLTEQILSRTRLLGIASNYHLYANSKHKGDPDALVSMMRKDIKIELVKANESQITAFKVSYSASGPRLAQQITGELTSLFIEDSLHNRQQLSEDTTQFLQVQLEHARDDLAQQEQRLREFKTRNLGELPEQLQGNLQILSGLQSRLQGATEALNQAEQQKLYLDSLMSQYRSQRSSAGDASPATLPVLEQQLEKMRSQLNDLSARYTPQHPDILHLREQIATAEKLKAKMEQDLKSGKKADASLPVVTPAEMQLEGQIKANDLNIANRKREISDLEMQLRQYEGRLNLTPMREQQLAAVTRDYQQSRTNYESLLAKKQQSEMATSLEKQQQGEQFRVLDPPSLPAKPYFPDRFLLSLVGFGAGVGLALGVLMFFELSDARIYLQEDLQQLTSAPVLVGIPIVATPAEERRKNLRRLQEVGGASLLFACMSLVTALAYLKR